MKKTIIIWIFIFILIAIIFEGVMRAQSGMPPLKAESRQFKYNYLDIHKKLYKKVREGGIDRYVCQRQDYEEYEGFSAVRTFGSTRIFALGGSVAYNWNGCEDVQEKDFEIINCGMPGYDSYRVQIIAKEILSYKPDLIIVLSGNNEFYPRQGFNPKIYYVNKFFSKFWAYRILQDYFLKLDNKSEFAFNRSREQMRLDYEKNIRLIVRNAKKKGVSVILCTLPVNFRDCPPLGRSPLDKQFILARILLENGNYLEAIDVFGKFSQDNPNNPLGYYFLGRTYDAMEKYQQAKENYLMSLEVSYRDDTATPSNNKTIRQICAEEEVGLVDLEKIFMDMAPHGLSGREQFLDHCHWWHEYYSLIDEAIVKEIFQNNAIYSKMFNSDRPKNRVVSSLPQFVFPSLAEFGKNQEYRDSITGNAVFNSIMNDNGLSERAICHFKTLYLMSPNELWNLQFSRERIKELFFDNKYLTETILDNNFSQKQWPWVLYHIGETYRRLKLYKEALVYFNNAIDLDEKNYLVYLGRALVYHALGEKQKARESIYKAEEKSNSNSLEIRYYKEILDL